MKKEYSRFESGNIFEGIVSVRALISAMQGEINNDRKIVKLLYTEEHAKSKAKELSWLRHRGKELGFELEAAEQDYIDEISTGNTHGGLIALASERTLPVLDGASIKDNGFYVMLEGIEDPYNFGYALRSLYAAGIDGVILGKRNWMSAAGVVCRASAGASELTEIYTEETFENAVERFKNCGYKIVCADIENSVPIYDADMTRPLLLVIGGEKRGISRKVMDMADSIVRIEYGRPFDASLSAASAATVTAFEVVRQENMKKTGSKSIL